MQGRSQTGYGSTSYIPKPPGTSAPESPKALSGNQYLKSLLSPNLLARSQERSSGRARQIWGVMCRRLTERIVILKRVILILKQKKSTVRRSEEKCRQFPVLPSRQRSRRLWTRRKELSLQDCSVLAWTAFRFLRQLPFVLRRYQQNQVRKKLRASAALNRPL